MKPAQRTAEPRSRRTSPQGKQEACAPHGGTPGRSNEAGATLGGSHDAAATPGSTNSNDAGAKALQPAPRRQRHDKKPAQRSAEAMKPAQRPRTQRSWRNDRKRQQAGASSEFGADQQSSEDVSKYPSKSRPLHTIASTSCHKLSRVVTTAAQRCTKERIVLRYVRAMLHISK